MNTSSLGGKFDFGIGMKSSWCEELVGRKCEEGCSNSGFFFLHSLGFLVDGFRVIGEVARTVVVVDDVVVVVVVVLVVVEVVVAVVVGASAVVILAVDDGDRTVTLCWVEPRALSSS